MITDEQVEAALAYLAQDPHPLATAEWELAKAKIAREKLGAELYLRFTGTVAEREAQIESNNVYGDLRYEEAAALRDVTNQKARVKSSDAVIEMWRTLQANARQAERVR